MLTILRGGKLLTHLNFAQNRPDVASAVGNSSAAASGFGGSVPAGAFRQLGHVRDANGARKSHHNIRIGEFIGLKSRPLRPTGVARMRRCAMSDVGGLSRESRRQIRR